MKRFLPILLGIKENTECTLSLHEISNNFYHIGTKHLKKFQESLLEFTPIALSLGDF